MAKAKRKKQNKKKNSLNFKILALGVGIILLIFGVSNLDITGNAVKNIRAAAQSLGGAQVIIPANAVEVSQGVFSLGSAIDVSGKKVEGYAIIDYGKGHAKPGTSCGNGICEAGENSKKCPADCNGGGGGAPKSTCYGFLAKDAKWKTVESWIVNPANNQGLSSDFIYNNLAGDVLNWENSAGQSILGSGTLTNAVLIADTASPDGQNEIYFGSIANSGAIAVTIVWGIFSGPPRGRELVEWDQIYDQDDFAWSENGEAGKMDFGNIATHELGHSVGLGDLYTGDCAEETMYGYAAYGETKKQTLEAGDIAGLKKLYK